MDSLLGKSIFSAAFPRSIDKADSAAAPRPCTAKAGGAGAGGQQQQSTSSSSSSSTNFATLPLPSRSSLPGPLKFLWFSRYPKEISSEDPFSVAESTGSADLAGSGSADFAYGTVIDPSGRSWQNIWGLRSWIGRPSVVQEGEQDQEQEAPAAIEELQDPAPGAKGILESERGILEESRPCPECEVDGCSIDSCSSEVEIPHVQVPHTRESFSRFLEPVSLAETRVIARMAHLCSLAYRVGDIKPMDLLSTHGLDFITSSLHEKEKALAKERGDSNPGPDSAPSESDGGSSQSRQISITPASAYSLASGVASYLHSHTKSLLPNRRKVDDAAGEDANSETSGDMNAAEEDYGSSEMADLIASSPVTAVVAAKEGTKDAVAKDLQSLHNCPCEWYCCDDRTSSTRYFVIQGSESLASWQANLLFEPTHFEDSSLGVHVHRGIYEAAKGLYEQLLPCVVEHLRVHGDRARLRFTGHSLGGSLATLVSLMLQIRGVVHQRDALLPVLTFGSPCTLCGGDYLLDKLGLPKDHIRSVMLHRDIVPRTFACSYPDHVAQILKRLNGRFRDHPCLNNQRLLYAPMGSFIILQPGEDDAPAHPLLPPGLGLYVMRHPQEGGGDVTSTMKNKIEVRSAQRAFLNRPHPLEILSDPGAYGFGGAICRDHDPRSYMKCITSVVRQEARKIRRLKREQRRGLWWPLVTAELSAMLVGSGGGGGGQEVSSVLGAGNQEEDLPLVVSGSAAAEGLYAGVIRGIHRHRQGQVVVLFFFSAKLVLMQSFATFFAWV